MSVTHRKEYQSTIAKISKRRSAIVCWGKMAHHSIAFIVRTFGQPAASVKRDLGVAYKEHPSRKALE